MADGRTPQPMILGYGAPQTLEAVPAQIAGRLFGSLLDAMLGNPERMEQERLDKLDLEKLRLSSGQEIDKAGLKKVGVSDEIIKSLLAIQESPEWGINRAVSRIMGTQTEGISQYVESPFQRPAGQAEAAWLPEIPLADIDPSQAAMLQDLLAQYGMAGEGYGYPLPAAEAMYSGATMESRPATPVEVARRISQLSPAYQGLLRREQERVPYANVIEAGLGRISMEKRQTQSYQVGMAQVAEQLAAAGVFPPGTNVRDARLITQGLAGDPNVPMRIQEMVLNNPALQRLNVRAYADAQSDVSAVLKDWNTYVAGMIKSRRKPKNKEEGRAEVGVTITRLALALAPLFRDPEALDPAQAREMARNMMIKGGMTFWSQDKRAYVSFADLLATNNKEDIQVANTQMEQAFEGASQAAASSPMGLAALVQSITDRWTAQQAGVGGEGEKPKEPELEGPPAPRQRRRGIRGVLTKERMEEWVPAWKRNLGIRPIPGRIGP